MRCIKLQEREPGSEHDGEDALPVGYSSHCRPWRTIA